MSRTIFTNVNLLDGECAARKGSTIAVVGDRIVAVNDPNLSAKPEDRLVDMGGRTIMPGMVAAHFHAPYRNGGGPDSSIGFTSLPQLSYLALSNAQTALRCGYTSAVSAATLYDIDAALAGSIDESLVVGPRFIPCSRFLVPSNENMDTPFRHFCTGPQAFVEAAEREIAGGAKIIKLIVSAGHGEVQGIDRNMTQEEVQALVDVARAHGVRTRAHVAVPELNLICARAGVDILDHVDGLDEECIEAIVEHDCLVLPSLFLPYICGSGQGKADYCQRFDPADYNHMLEMLPRAMAAGVKIIPGDDYGVWDLPHGDYARELVWYVEEAGFSPLEVINCVTRNGGALTGIADLGTIAAGKLADFLVVDGDPSVDIRILLNREHIQAVVKGGKLAVGQMPEQACRVPALA